MFDVTIKQEILGLYEWNYKFKTEIEANEFSKYIVENGFKPDSLGKFVEKIGIDNDDNIEIQINKNIVYSIDSYGDVLENSLFE